MMELDPLSIAAWGSRDDIKPKIVQAWNQEDLGDDPDHHRWRASWYDTWDHEHCGGRKVVGILLAAYPVTRLTPCGAWIDKASWRENIPAGRQWKFTGQTRWVSDDGGAAFAKPTRDEALHSIAYRLMRWNQKTQRDVRRLRQAAIVCNALLPEIAKRYTKGIEEPF